MTCAVGVMRQSLLWSVPMTDPSPATVARVMTLPEVAAVLRVSVPTLRSWYRSGKLQCVRLPGGTLRVSIAEVERLAGGPIA